MLCDCSGDDRMLLHPLVEHCLITFCYASMSITVHVLCDSQTHYAEHLYMVIGWDMEGGPASRDHTGLTVDRNCWRSFAIVRVVSEAKPKELHTFNLRTSKQSPDWQRVCRQRNYSMLWLTDGNFSDLTRVDPKPSEVLHHNRTVVYFQQQVLAYHADLNIFLMRKGWERALNRFTTPKQELYQAVDFEPHMYTQRATPAANTATVKSATPAQSDASMGESVATPKHEVSGEAAMQSTARAATDSSSQPPEVFLLPWKTTSQSDDKAELASRSGVQQQQARPDESRSLCNPAAAVSPHSEAANTDALLSLASFSNELLHGTGNILLCGAAGTGKSHVTQGVIVPVLKSVYGEEHVWSTATTTQAATGVDGTTLHSIAGVKLAKGKLLWHVFFNCSQVSSYCDVHAFWCHDVMHANCICTTCKWEAFALLGSSS